MEMEEERMLSRDCDACSQMFDCKRRFQRVTKGEKVFCPDGTAHLVDVDSESRNR